jgi:hypothetical protein
MELIMKINGNQNSNLSFSADRKIFHVDDMGAFRRFVKMAVDSEIKPVAEKAGDTISLVQAENLPQAMNALKGSKFDVVISDGSFPNHGDYKHVYNETVGASKLEKDKFILLSADTDSGEEIEQKGSVFIFKDAYWTTILPKKLKEILYNNK